MEVFFHPQVSQSPRIGPLAQHIHRYGLLGLPPPQFLLTCHQIVISIYTYKFSLWLIGFYNPKPLLYIKEVRRYRHTRYKKSFKGQNLIYPSHKSKLCKKTTREKLEFRDWGESNNTYKMKTNLRGSLTIFSPLRWLFTYLSWILLQEEELSILFTRLVFTTVFESGSEISINALGLGYRILLHSSFGHLIRDTFSHIFSKTILWLMLQSRGRDYLFFCLSRWSLFIFIIFMFMIFKFLNKKPSQSSSYKKKKKQKGLGCGKIKLKYKNKA